MEAYGKLDGRLRAVYDLVRPGARVADVGTDHGYLVCALVQQGKCPGGVAADIRPGPLGRAREVIAHCSLEGRIRTALGDGLAGISPAETDDIVIAGMGGETIEAIVGAAPWLRDPQKRLVLQPMTKAPALRRFLYGAGFEILEERAARAGRFLYAVLCAGWCGAPRFLTPLEAHAGRLAQSAAAEGPGSLSRALLLHQAAQLRAAGRGLCRSAARGREGQALLELAAALEALARGRETGEGEEA